MTVLLADIGTWLSGPWPPVFLIGAGTLLMLLAVLSYRPAFGMLRTGEVALLLFLRAAAIAGFVLFLGYNWYGTTTRERSLAVLVDVSKSMTIRDSMGGSSRIETASMFLAEDAPLLDNLPSSIRVRWFSFDGSARELPAEGLGPNPVAEGDKSDPASALRNVTGGFAPGELAGIVLLTDGSASRGSDPVRASSEAGVPVFPVGFGTAGPDRPGFRDLALDPVKGNDSVFVGNVHEIEVALEARGFSGLSPIEVSVKKGNERVASATITPKPGETRWTASLSFRPEEEGIFDYEVSVPLLEGEAVEANNSFHFPLHVLGGKIRVLYVEGTLRAEGKFIKRALDEDPNVECTALIRIGPGRFMQQGPGESLVRDGQLALDRDALDRFNVVILGDIERAGIPAGIDASLEGFVDEGGGGLMALGGHASLGAGGWAGTSLEKILPVLLGSLERREYSFLPALTADGVGHPIFAGYEDFFTGAVRVDKALPPLKGANLVVAVKPGAAVLACAGTGSRPLVVAHRFGRGKTLVLTADTTWLWYLPLRGLGRESPFNRFWSQSVRWLTDTGKDLDESNPLRLWTPRRTYPAGSEVNIELRVLPPPEGTAPLSGAPVLDGFGPDETGEAVNLLGEGRMFTGRYRAEEPGIHRLRASILRADGKRYEKEISIAVGGRSEEFDRVSLDEQRLDRIASASGGRVFTPVEGEALAREIEKRLHGASRASERTRLDDPSFLVLGLLFLCAEWALRRRKLLV